MPRAPYYISPWYNESQFYAEAVLRVGDMIESETGNLFFKHWSVYIGRKDDGLTRLIAQRCGRVSWSTIFGFSSHPDYDGVEDNCELSDLFENGLCRINNYYDRIKRPLNERVIVGNALDPQSNRTHYHALFMNCETYAFGCRYGVYFPRSLYFYASIFLLFAAVFLYFGGFETQATALFTFACSGFFYVGFIAGLPVTVLFIGVIICCFTGLTDFLPFAVILMAICFLVQHVL
uniref:LRAT domain-containing protein n=1 Tax=Panagrolaimus sp. ES5 TaxID=591445 RepID=A0AC34FIE4_9BILA